MTYTSGTLSKAFVLNHQKTAMLKLLIGASNHGTLNASEKLTIESANWVIRTIDKGHTLLCQGEECCTISIIMSGWAFSHQTLSDGKRQILDFALAGTLLGFGANRTSQRGVETITPCVVASLPISQFYGVLARCPHFAVQIAECIVDSELRAHAHLTHLGRRSARERVAALIVELITRISLHNVKGNEQGFDLPLTLTMIADALGLTCEHVCRTLSKMADDGVLELKRHSLRVSNSAVLYKEAGVEQVNVVHGVINHSERELDIAA